MGGRTGLEEEQKVMLVECWRSVLLGIGVAVKNGVKKEGNRGLEEKTIGNDGEVKVECPVRERWSGDNKAGSEIWRVRAVCGVVE